MGQANTDSYNKKNINIAIRLDLCKGCGICVGLCRKEVFKMSDDYNYKGYKYAAVANVEKCNFCNECAMRCPDFAIFVSRY